MTAGKRACCWELTSPARVRCLAFYAVASPSTAKRSSDLEPLRPGRKKAMVASLVAIILSAKANVNNEEVLK